MDRDGRGWEHVAEEWIAWTRGAGDAYASYREAFLSLVPAAAGRTLDLGCGEGRVTRDLARLGHAVTGVDASPTLVAAAVEAHPEGDYAVANAELLPFADETFGLVVAHNLLMDVQDMPAVVREAARVLTPGGRLCIAITHPLADAGRWEGDGDDAPFVVAGSYLAVEELEETIERDGVRMTFAGRRYPLEQYSRALEDAGLLVEALREPAPAPGSPGFGRWSRVPNFLHVRAVKR